MRLNKKKLAALAMSAVMAASTMPFPVLAEEFTDGTETTAVEQAEVAEFDEGATKPEATQIEWAIIKNEDGTYAGTATYKGKPWTIESSDIQKVSDSTCTSAERVSVTVIIDGFEINEASVPVKNVPALGHDYDYDNPDYDVVKDATCTELGVKEKTYTCKVCGYVDHTGVTEPIPQKDHTLVGDITTTYGAPCYNVTFSNGKPQVIDPSMNAYWTVYTTQHCSVCDKDITTETTEHYDAKQISYYTVDIANSVNIANSKSNQALLSGRFTYLDDIKEIVDKLELKDCGLDGTLAVKGWKSTDSTKPALTDTIPVGKHHSVVARGVLVSKADASLLSLSEKEGKLVVKNTSCWKDVQYKEIEYCNAEGCKSTLKADAGKTIKLYDRDAPFDSWKVASISETKTAAHEGTHAVDNTKRTNFITYINSIKKDGYVNYTELKEAYDSSNYFTTTDKKYVKLSENTATCTEAGTATIKFYCNTPGCNTLVESKTITVITPSLGHDYQPTTVKSSVVESTCKNSGHREVAQLCTRCGQEKPGSQRTTIYEKRKAHSNEFSVADTGVGTDNKSSDKNAYIKFIGDKVIDNKGAYLTKFANNVKTYSANKTEKGIYAQVCTNCEYCGDHEVVVENGNPITLTIIDIEKESASGAAGHITLKATYNSTKLNNSKVVTEEITVPYFSSLLAYQGRVEPEVINGLHTDKDGFTRYYEDGKVVETTGIIKYAGREYLVKDGVLCDSTHGVTLVGDTFYFLANGCVQRGYTGVAIYDNESFYLSNGVVDTNVNGLVPYQGGTFLFAAGRLVKEHNGLWQNSDGTWYFLALGQVQTQYTGVAEYDGAYFYVKSGKLDTTKNGTITVDGVKYTAVNGQLYK